MVSCLWWVGLKCWRSLVISLSVVVASICLVVGFVLWWILILVGVSGSVGMVMVTDALMRLRFWFLFLAWRLSVGSFGCRGVSKCLRLLRDD